MLLVVQREGPVDATYILRRKSEGTGAKTNTAITELDRATAGQCFLRRHL